MPYFIVYQVYQGANGEESVSLGASVLNDVGAFII